MGIYDLSAALLASDLSSATSGQAVNVYGGSAPAFEIVVEGTGTPAAVNLTVKVQTSSDPDSSAWATLDTYFNSSAAITTAGRYFLAPASNGVRLGKYVRLIVTAYTSGKILSDGSVVRWGRNS